MFTVYLIDAWGEAFARYETTFDRLPQRTDGRYYVLTIDAVKGHWLWIGRTGDMLSAPRLARRVNLERVAA